MKNNILFKCAKMLLKKCSFHFFNTLNVSINSARTCNNFSQFLNDVASSYL